jgi:hypothetical protein
MSSTEYIIGGASILVGIRPASKGVPVDPRIARVIASLLAILEKADSVDMLGNFTRWTDAFVEEVDAYLEKNWLEMLGLGQFEVDILSEVVPQGTRKKSDKKK